MHIPYETMLDNVNNIFGNCIRIYLEPAGMGTINYQLDILSMAVRAGIAKSDVRS